MSCSMLPKGIAELKMQMHYSWCVQWEAHKYGGALALERDMKIIGACASHHESDMHSDYFPLMNELPHFCLLSGVTGRLFQVCPGLYV